MPRSTIIVAAAVASLLLAVEARAQRPAEIRITEENDEFNWFTDRTDRYYTQGARVEWLSPPRERDAHFLPGITHAAWCSLICGADAARRGVDAGYAVGQNIYTPANTFIAAPQPNDRPWAGLLYGSRIARISYAEPSLAAQRQDRIEVSLGIVGPASLAKEAQIGLHDLIGAGRPAGWDNQLRNEPVLQLRYDIALRWPQEDGGNADIIPRVRVNLGNALTSLEADLTGRIGWNLSGFGVRAIPSAAGAATGQANALTGARWLASGNLFLRAGMKAVAHNIFLDGNSFAGNDIRIHRTTFVPEAAAGVEMNLVGDFWLTFQFIHRGSEFRTRSGREAPGQEIGSFTIAWIVGS
jgi:lipid A 3-O-deacylase